VPRLRSSLLFCGTLRVTGRNPAHVERVRLLWLLAALSLFLWMFLAAAPLEQLADAGAFGPGPAERDAAFAFAASWRHGMAGNAPLYMPGFFAVAVAVWVWSEIASTLDRRGRAAAGAAVVTAAVAAWIAGSMSAPLVISSFERTSGLTTAFPAPWPPVRAVGAGLYTLLTWSAFVLGSRLALTRRSLWPLIPVPALTAGLMAIRPWTVDDFAATWGRRVVQGDPFAMGSLLGIPLIATLLVARETSLRARAVQPSSGSRSLSNLT